MSAAREMISRLFPPANTFGGQLVAFSIMFAGVRLVWDALLGPLLVPYLPEVFFTPDAARADSAAIVLAIGYLAVVIPVLVFVGALPLTLALRVIDAHSRRALAGFAHVLLVAVALVDYELVWRYVAYPLARTIGLVVTGAVVLWVVVSQLSDRARMREPID